MTRGAKMLMLANNRNRSNRDGNREGRMNYEMQNGYGMESNYEVDSRFRDRRGREHYDDGRFAPMRSDMQGDYDVWSNSEMDPRSRDSRGRERYDDGRSAPRSNAVRWMPPYYDVDINRYEYEVEKPENRGGRMNMRGGSGMEMRRGESNTRGDGEMRMIGFERDPEMRMASDASMPRYQEMDRMQGSKAMHGGAMSHGSPQFDEHMAREWTAMMENEDGTKGPHWTMEQAKKVLEQRNLRCDPYEFWAVLNAIYSDDVAVAKKHGVNKMDYYVDRAVAWLEDKDAQEGKAGRYFEYIVKH